MIAEGHSRREEEETSVVARQAGSVVVGAEGEGVDNFESLWADQD